MGYSFSTYVYLGLKIDINDLQSITRKRGCGHDKTDKKYCGECGALTIAEEESEVPEWVYEECYSGFDVTSINCDSDIIVVGKKLADIPDDHGNIARINELTNTDYKGLLTCIRKKFGNEKWYNEDMFRMWLILYESY